VRRAIELHTEGNYRTDISDHKNIHNIPDIFPNKDRYRSQLVVLRDDRNIADYSHDAEETDLVLTQDIAEALVTDFIGDARNFLKNRGVSI